MATSHSDTAFLTIEKSFTYRGTREHWVNTYHFDNIPPDSTQWQAIYVDLINKELAFLPVDVQVEGATGHNPGTPPVLVWEIDQPPPGEGGPVGLWIPQSGDGACPGDAAFFIRYGTTQKNKLGKPIYLWNYYHGAYHRGVVDLQASSQFTAAATMAAALVTGLSHGGVTYRRAGPRGAVAQNYKVGDFLTTRTLKHRGKRHRFGSPGSAPAGYRWYLGKLPPDVTLN